MWVVRRGGGLSLAIIVFKVQFQVSVRWSQPEYSQSKPENSQKTNVDESPKFEACKSESQTSARPSACWELGLGSKPFLSKNNKSFCITSIDSSGYQIQALTSGSGRTHKGAGRMDLRPRHGTGDSACRIRRYEGSFVLMIKSGDSISGDRTQDLTVRLDTITSWRSGSYTSCGPWNPGFDPRRWISRFHQNLDPLERDFEFRRGISCRILLSPHQLYWVASLASRLTRLVSGQPSVVLLETPNHFWGTHCTHYSWASLDTFHAAQTPSSARIQDVDGIWRFYLWGSNPGFHGPQLV